MSEKKVRLIAFYLPQFHPIPENDERWGKGFTEWTNVAKAKPLFRGHYQPHLPSDLGYYDLRVPEVREQQAELARHAGIEGFCYWHYWFGNEKRALERVFNEVVESGKPNFRFCLAWANESWTGRWHGLDSQIIFKQEYPGMEDCQSHFYALLDAFRDPRYIRVHDRLLFLVYRPENLPDSYLHYWQELAQKEGTSRFYFVGCGLDEQKRVRLGYDAIIAHCPTVQMNRIESQKPHMLRLFNRVINKLKRKYCHLTNKVMIKTCKKVEYRKFARYMKELPLGDREFPIVLPNWDNTPRCGNNGYILIKSHPDLFRDAVRDTAAKLWERPQEDRVLFVKSWNEWAEGNYIEPDREYGHDWLEALRAGIENNTIGNE